MSFEITNKCELFIGQFCISKSGRDKGKVYIVYEIVDEDYVLLVNGKDRSIKNPKKKNIKHLQKINDIIENFETNKQQFSDLEIKRIVKLKIQKEA